MWAFYNWIRDCVKENKPWDKFARDIFTGAGSSRQNGALNYFVLHKDPIDLTENVTQAFLGQRLTCARCHNHPLEKWTQKQYYQMANLFSRVGVKNGDDSRRHRVSRRPPAISIIRGCCGRCSRRRSTASRCRSMLRRTGACTSRTGSPARRTTCSRAPSSIACGATSWARAWCDPIDDVRATNPASNEELFAAVTKISSSTASISSG